MNHSVGLHHGDIKASVSQSLLRADNLTSGHVEFSPEFDLEFGAEDFPALGSNWYYLRLSISFSSVDALDVNDCQPLATGGGVVATFRGKWLNGHCTPYSIFASGASSHWSK
jgi:hypothetical protein